MSVSFFVFGVVFDQYHYSQTKLNPVVMFVLKKRGTMRLPTMTGMIDRRMLVNFRVEPEVLARFLPAPFQPKLIHGYGMAGICLIRLKGIRPTGLPAWLGVGSENAAHRIAVTWQENGTQKEGVYIPRRDSSSMLNHLVGGRIFPGYHHAARFEVSEGNGNYSIHLESTDGDTRVSVQAQRSTTLPATSIFHSLAEASAFFQGGALGYSATPQKGIYDGLELHTQTWHIEPLAVDAVESSFFADTIHFPLGSVTFDNALLMEQIAHEWRGHPSLWTAPQPTPCF